jgi:NAD(P)-dependent dehydrogenase (short-subunit alcohol dehydrogenase family)
MDLELTGKVALITGGSRGIGKAIALALAREGADVAICARSQEALDVAAQEIAQATDRRIIPLPADTTSEASVAQLVQSAVSALGRVDILVNNAATPGGLVRGALADVNETELLDDINTKVVGYMRCAKAVAPHMQQRGWGRIINIGGLSGRRSGVISGLRNAAVVHLTKTLADQLGQYGITVNLVHPGTTRTERSGPMYAERAQREGTTVDAIERAIGQNNAIRRIVDAEEIGHVAAFLASPKSGAITGVAIDASGGSIPVVFQ